MGKSKSDRVLPVSAQDQGSQFLIPELIFVIDEYLVAKSSDQI